MRRSGRRSPGLAVDPNARVVDRLAARGCPLFCLGGLFSHGGLTIGDGVAWLLGILRCDHT